ncbi:MAG: plastocyanin/azurin family copper-binding protein [Solirubrobacterales bacterium]
MKKTAAALALILAALTLAACGGGGGDTTSVTAEETGGAAAESEAGGEGGAAAEGEAEAEGGTAGTAKAIAIEANPEGQLAYEQQEVTAKAGEDTIDFTNQSSVPHDVSIEDSAGKTIAQTEIVSEGSASATADLEPGTYTFYCSVPGHRQAGMEGTLVVK